MRNRCHLRIALLSIAVGILGAGVAAAGPYEDNMKAARDALLRRNWRAVDDYARKAAAADQAKGMPFRVMGQARLMQGDFRGAAEQAREATQREPDDAWGYYELGLYLLYANSVVHPDRYVDWKPTPEVIDALGTAWKKNPRFAEAAGNLGGAYFEMKQYDEALIYLKRAIEINPNDARWHSNLGEVLLAQGRNDDAAAEFARAESARLYDPDQDSRNRTTADLYLNWADAELGLKPPQPDVAKLCLQRLMTKITKGRYYEAAARKLREIDDALAEDARKRKEEEEKRRQQLVAAQKKDTIPPKAVILYPDAVEAGRERVLAKDDDTLHIAGVATDDIGVVRVTVQGQEVGLSTSKDLAVVQKQGDLVHFAADVPLKPGQNRIEVVAYDRAGNKGTAQLTITAKKEQKQDVVQVAQNDVQQVEATKGQRYALLVGVNQYNSKEINTLTCSAKDVRALRDLLVDPKRAAFPPENVVLMTDDQQDPTLQPNRLNIYKKLSWLAGKAEPRDMILVYYSGHGYQDAVTKTSYLLPEDTDPQLLKDSAIPNDEFLKRIADIKAEKKLIILDACHSGGVGKMSKGAMESLGKDYWDQFGRSKGTAVLASCSASEQSFEMPGGQNSVFTNYLVKGLTLDGDENHDGVVTFQEAANYVGKAVSAWAAQNGKKQTPLYNAEGIQAAMPISTVRKFVLEKQIEWVQHNLDDQKVQKYSLTLLAKEPQQMNPDEKLVLRPLLEQVCSGEQPKDYYLSVLKRLNTMGT